MKIQNVSRRVYYIPGGKVGPGEVLEVTDESHEIIKGLLKGYPEDFRDLESKEVKLAKLAPVAPAAESEVGAEGEEGEKKKKSGKKA